MESISLSGTFNAFAWFLRDVSTWSTIPELASTLLLKENVTTSESDCRGETKSSRGGGGGGMKRLHAI